MKAFRGIFSFWNEVGLLISLLLSAGYFGSRAMLGYFPALVLVFFLIGAGVLAALLSRDKRTEDDYSERRFSFFDKCLMYFCLFLLGIVLFTSLGLYL